MNKTKYKTVTKVRQKSISKIDMKEPEIIKIGFFAYGLYIKKSCKVRGVCLFDKISWDNQLGFSILK